MALTVNRVGDWQKVAGGLRKSSVHVAFDSSYPTAGESFTPADVGLRVIDMILIEPTNGFYFEYDYGRQTIRVYKSQSSGVIHVDMSNMGNRGTGEDELIVYNMPTNVLSTGNMLVRATAWGTTRSNANTKILRGYFGSASTGMGYIHSHGVSWRAVMEVVRTGAATEDSCLKIEGASTAGTVSTASIAITTSTLTEDTTSILQIKLTGTATTTDDIVQQGLMVEALAPNLSGGGWGIEVPNTTDLSSLNDVRVVVWGY